MIDNLKQKIEAQCGKYFRKRVTLQDALSENDLKILIDQNPLRDENKIQSIREAYNLFSNSPGEDLCQKTADNLFSEYSTFFITTKDNSYLEFMIHFDDGLYSDDCDLLFAYEYKESYLLTVQVVGTTHMQDITL